MIPQRPLPLSLTGFLRWTGLVLDASGAGLGLDCHQSAMGPPLTELRFAVALPSAASTKAGLAAEAFWRLVVLSVLMGLPPGR
jgi:hypothetical protein